MRHAAWTVGYFAFLSWMVLVGFAYNMLSPGLAAHTSDGPFFCSGLQSSGSDDDALIATFALFLLPFALRLAHIKRDIAKIELFVFSLCQCLTIFALWLASLDCAEISYTAFVVPDPALGGALIALPGSTIALLALRHRR